MPSTSRSASSKASNDPYLDKVLGFGLRWTTPIAIVSILCAGGFIFWVFASSAHADTLAGRVVGVSDGDTITILDAANQQHKIRISGIDAPEKKQPYGARSKQRMSYLVFDKAVLVDYSKQDRYGRIVGKVMVSSPAACPDSSPECPKTLDAGLAMIAVGLAWHYKQYGKEQTEGDRNRYAFAEIEAKVKRTGLWKDQNPMPPWAWRQVRRAQHISN